MFTIRTYKHSDYEMIQSWCDAKNEPAPLRSMLLTDTSYILEKNGIPVYTLTLFLTNCKEICYLENFSKNPNNKDKECVSILVEYVFNKAREYGYKRAVGFCYTEKLKKRYQDLGMKPTVDNVLGLVKEL